MCTPLEESTTRSLITSSEPVACILTDSISCEYLSQVCCSNYATTTVLCFCVLPHLRIRLFLLKTTSSTVTYHPKVFIILLVCNLACYRKEFSWLVRWSRFSWIMLYILIFLVFSSFLTMNFNIKYSLHGCVMDKMRKMCVKLVLKSKCLSDGLKELP